MRTWQNEEIEETTSHCHKAGSSAVLNIAFEWEGKKKLLQYNEPRQTGLNFVERTRRGVVLVVK